MSTHEQHQLHTLLANFLALRWITQSQLRKIYSRIIQVSDAGINGTITEESLTRAIQTLNETLDELGMKIEMIHDQKTRAIEYVLANKKPVSVPKIGTAFSPTEIEYFRALIDYMFDPERNTPLDRFWISESHLADANRVHSTTDGNSRTRYILDSRELQGVVSRLEQEGWLKHVEDENDSDITKYALSNRSLCELLPYLKDKYGPEEGEIGSYRACSGCSKIFTTGWQCPTNGCLFRTHEGCSGAVLRGICKDNKSCPNCGADIAEKHVMVGI